jgi:uncharacterized protein YhhL (DUF1145 family)
MEWVGLTCLVVGWFVLMAELCAVVRPLALPIIALHAVLLITKAVRMAQGAVLGSRMGAAQAQRLQARWEVLAQVRLRGRYDTWRAGLPVLGPLAWDAYRWRRAAEQELIWLATVGWIKQERPKFMNRACSILRSEVFAWEQLDRPVQI